MAPHNPRTPPEFNWQELLQETHDSTMRQEGMIQAQGKQITNVETRLDDGQAHFEKLDTEVAKIKHFLSPMMTVRGLANRFFWIAVLAISAPFGVWLWDHMNTHVPPPPAPPASQAASTGP